VPLYGIAALQTIRLAVRATIENAIKSVRRIRASYSSTICSGLCRFGGFVVIDSLPRPLQGHQTLITSGSAFGEQATNQLLLFE
jgi:hypothetical protein